MNEPPKELVRTLSVFQGVVLAVSLVIGSGVLGLPGIVLEEIGPRYAALAWVLTAAAMVPFIVVFSALGAHFPSSPGLLSYAEFAFGKAGRNAASLILLSCIVIGFPALLLIGGSYFQVIFGLGPNWVPVLAVGLLALSVAVNLIGLRAITGFNSVSVVLLTGFMVLVTVWRTDYFGAGLTVLAGALTGVFQDGRSGVANLWKGSALIFWAFLGWENLGFGVQEIKNPRRAVPLIFALSFVLVTILFLLPAFTSIGAALRGNQGILGAAGLISLMDGSVLKPYCSLVLVLVIIGNANAWMYAVSRLLYAEATDGILPRSLGQLSSRHVPAQCLLLTFLVVMTCIGISWWCGVKISHLILLVNQNFLFLFLASIWAYAKIGTSGMRWLIVGGALATCSLFLSGFSFLILFPLALISLGVAIHERSRRRESRTA